MKLELISDNEQTIMVILEALDGFNQLEELSLSLCQDRDF